MNILNSDNKNIEIMKDSIIIGKNNQKKKLKLIIKRDQSIRKKRSPRKFSPNSPPCNNNDNSLKLRRVRRKSPARRPLSIELPKTSSPKSVLAQHSPAVFNVSSPMNFSMMSPLLCSSPSSNSLGGNGILDTQDDFEIVQKVKYDPTAWQVSQCINIPRCRQHNFHDDINLYNKRIEEEKLMDNEINSNMNDKLYYLNHYNSFLSHTQREEEVLNRSRKKLKSSTSSTNSDDKNKKSIASTDKSLLKTNENGDPIIPSGLSREPTFNYTFSKYRRNTNSWTRPKNLIWYREDETRLLDIQRSKAAAMKQAKLVVDEYHSMIMNNSNTRKKKRSRSATITPKSSKQLKTTIPPPSSSSSSIIISATVIPPPSSYESDPNDPREALRQRQQELLEQLNRIRGT